MMDPGLAEEHLAPSQAPGGTPTHGEEGSLRSQHPLGERSTGLRLAELIVGFAASYALMGGVISLLGWVLDVPRFKDWTGAGVTMKANTAICTACGGLALWLTLWGKGKALLRFCAGIVLLIGSLTLLQHLSGWNFGIDTLLFSEAPGAAATTAPGRMGLPASTSFTLLGWALLLLGARSRSRKLAAQFGIIAVCIASLSLVGFLFGASQLYHIPRVTGITFQTASMIFVLGFGVVFAVPEHNLAYALRRRDAGGALLRRLILPIIFLPIIIGWLRMRGEAMGLYDAPFGTAARTVTEIIFLLVILWWTARGLSASDAAFRLSEAELKEAQQLAHIGGWRWVPETDTVIASTELYRIFGLSPKDPFPDFKEQHGTIYPVDSWYQINQAKQSALKTGLGFSMDVDAFRTGQRIHVSARGEPVRDSLGRIIGLRGTVQDITERKEAEEVIRQRERELAALNQQLALRAEELDALVEQRTAKLKELVADLEAFSYSMAHDLRGPIRTIEGFADLLIDEYHDKLDLAGKDYLDRIRSASDRMQRLISDVLTYTRITHELLPVEPVSVNTILQEVIEHYPTLREANIRVAGELPVVLANRNGMTQVLSNLLTNAVKFAPPDRATHVEVSAERNGEFVILSVKDDGIGIAPEHHARIFQMFERLHHEKDYEGTGIGLAVVRRIVERMGGTISLESKLSEGSRFMVRLREAQFPDYRPTEVTDSKHKSPAGSKRAPATLLLLAVLGLGLVGINAAEKEPAYAAVRQEKYPCTLHLIKVPRTDRRWEIRSLHADGKALGLEELSRQLKRPGDIKPVAAVNGDYYVRQGAFAGDPRGLQISHGELISGPAEGASFWIDALDAPNVGITSSRFSVQWPNGSQSPIELNAEGKDDAIVLVTAAVGPEYTSRGGPELILERDGNSPWLPLRPGRIYSAKVAEQKKAAKVRLTTNQMALSLPRRSKAPKVEDGAVLKISTMTEPSLRGVSEAISGGPILVRDGKRAPIKAVASDSYMFSSMHERHPRSAIGWNDEYYFLVSVDGRQGDVSVGLTLEEFSAELIKLGCNNAMNLDGGGSATLWFQGKVRNYLCDGYERKIANGLTIVEKH